MYILKQKNQSLPNDDIFIISKEDYKKINNKNFKGFLNTFSVNDHHEVYRDESELTFAYFHKEYVYFSKIMMQIAQELIRIFLKWCQYEKLILYYYNIKKLKKIKIIIIKL